ncbi:hypothetical protein F5Y16DRAFT_366955 [Xylariaceae sp. FL0255]|nr:hypothetical protein F5Y16DRAFT_366955 [Xylariaceae sp. FL0255]
MAFPLIGAPRGLRLIPTASFFVFVIILIALYRNTDLEQTSEILKQISNKVGVSKPEKQNHRPSRPTNTFPPVKYKPTPTEAVPVISEPFPLLANSAATPPPIPVYNAPKDGLHRQYGLSYMPPLFIGFTRQWPMLLQCVVSYITAGWPPESIYVVENTGVQNSNAKGELTLQNPFYLNHTTLKRLGVNVLPTPVLLTFSQMQNFFLSTAISRSWDYYFYSHQDVLVFSFEDGADTMRRPGDREWFFYDEQDKIDTMRPQAAGQEHYRTIYENSLQELNYTREVEDRWAFRWFQYDHLTLVNRAALDAVGGWDSLMPYYMSDCDMNARLEMDGWTMKHRRVGIINDVSTVMEDLGALYRDPTITPRFVDPNPIPDPPPEEEPEQSEQPATPDGTVEAGREDGKKIQPTEDGVKNEAPVEPQESSEDPNKPTEKRGQVDINPRQSYDEAINYFRALVKVGDDMGGYKYRNKDLNRNSWQMSQHGGEGEPYHYDAEGFSTSFWILAEAGREVFRQKWGHRDCDLTQETALQLEDQWRVEKDWED